MKNEEGETSASLGSSRRPSQGGGWTDGEPLAGKRPVEGILRVALLKVKEDDLLFLTLLGDHLLLLMKRKKGVEAGGVSVD